MKKALSLMLVGTMTVGLLSACGKTEEPASSVAESSVESSVEESVEETTEEEQVAEVGRPEEHVTLKMYFEGANVTDDSEALAAINDYLDEKLNVTLEPVWGTWGDFDTNAVLALQGGDDVDIYFTCSWTANEYGPFAKDGYYVRLDDPDNNLIEKYGKEVWDILPEVLKIGAEVDGADGRGVYAVPGFKDTAAQYCWDVNVTKLEELGYTLDDIKSRSFFDFGDIFAAAKEKFGDDFYPLLPEGTVLEEMVTNCYGVTGDTSEIVYESINPEDPSKPGAHGTTLVNRFATDEFKDYAKKVREYYLAGYIDPQVTNSEQSASVRTNHQLEGSYLIGTQSYAFGYEAQVSKERGIDVQFVPTSPAFTNTVTSQGAMMAISTASKNPERAMMFLNLLNTDPYLFTLVDFGVEGTHYNLNDEGEAVFTDKHADYSLWINGTGNVTLLPPQEGQGADFQDKFREFYGNAYSLPTLGWSMNCEEISDKCAAVANASAEYALPLDMGSVDPDDVLEGFIKKLNDNGAEDVVQTANDQLAEFLAAN
ncbi:MAG: ABC transporter substrate-binding protein [Lachnospiraceae bacterium]|nr:ABC transporter substrate-binding protein [Lachnospiraceae bacterium]